jgi:hypothetical protein
MAQNMTNTGYRKLPASEGNQTKQVPAIINRIPVRQALVPSKEIIYNRPDYVLINNTGSYSFLYATTGSVGDNAPNLAASFTGVNTDKGYITGSIINAAGAYQGNITPTKLDINPVAWTRIDATGAVGDITFIYAGRSLPDGGPR